MTMPVKRMSDKAGALVLVGDAFSAGRRVVLNSGRATAAATSSSSGGGGTRFGGAACARGSAAAAAGAALSVGPSSSTIAVAKIAHAASHGMRARLLIVSPRVGFPGGGNRRLQIRHRDGS